MHANYEVIGPECDEHQRARPMLAGPDEAVALAVTEEEPRALLDMLMRDALSSRFAVRRTQRRLLDTVLEVRKAPADKRGGLERVHVAALETYRSARVEAARTRCHLISALRRLHDTRPS